MHVRGESLANPELLNLRGQAYRVYDGAGVQTAVAYDFKGGLLAAERQLGVDYTQTLDWSGLSELEDVSDLEVAAASMLESEVFRTEGTFDALGRPTTQTTPDGTVVRLAYNEAALLEGVSANVRGAVSETAFVSNIDYDAKGRRTLIAYGNGTETSYAYDDITQRLTRLRTTDTTRTFQDLAYTYDAVGNIVEIGDAAQDDVYFGGAVVTATQRFEYDALYRLTNAEGREHAGQNAAQPTEFGASPSLHPQDGTAMRAYAEQYVYDVVGNILSMQHTAASGNWTRRYQYASNGNRLQANSAPGDAVGVYSHAYSHDAHGNMTAMPHLSAVTWNYADQMRSADLGGGGTAYFVYDGGGQRVRKVRVNQAGTQTYERIYLGAYELYRERTSGTLQLERETLHIADDGGRMCDLETRTVEGGTPVSSPTTHHRYQYSNHLGSASLELTASAEVISYEEYHPYGTSAYRAVNSSIDVSERRYRYTGKERDEETGLGYHGARYYACWLGRWTASDPIGLGDGVNRYAYVSGNPVSFVDPSGGVGEAPYNDPESLSAPYMTPEGVAEEGSGVYVWGPGEQETYALTVEQEREDEAAREAGRRLDALVLQDENAKIAQARQASLSPLPEPDVPLVAEVGAGLLLGPAYDALEIDAAERAVRANPTASNRLNRNIAIFGAVPFAGDVLAPIAKRIVGIGGDVIAAVVRRNGDEAIEISARLLDDGAATSFSRTATDGGASALVTPGTGAAAGGGAREVVQHVQHRAGNRQVSVDGRRWNLPKDTPIDSIPSADPIGDQLQSAATAAADRWSPRLMTPQERLAIARARAAGEGWRAGLLQAQARGRWVERQLRDQFPQLNWSRVGPDVQHGDLAYDLMSGTISNMTRHAKRMDDVLFRFITF